MRILLILLLALPLLAGAKDYCAPRTWYWPVTTATKEVEIVEADGGKYSSWWCQRDDKTWVMRRKAQLPGYDTPEMRAKAEDVIRSADTPDAGVTLAFELLSVTPPAGTEDRYRFDLLLHKACVTGLPNSPTKPTTPCPPAPTPLPGPVEQDGWVVGKATLADGTRPAYRYDGIQRGSTVVDRPLAGTKCDVSLVYETTSQGKWLRFAPNYVDKVAALCVPLAK